MKIRLKEDLLQFKKGDIFTYIEKSNKYRNGQSYISEKAVKEYNKMFELYQFFDGKESFAVGDLTTQGRVVELTFLPKNKLGVKADQTWFISTDIRKTFSVKIKELRKAWKIN